MRLWIVKVKGYVGYDEISELLISAPSEKEALDFAKNYKLIQECNITDITYEAPKDAEFEAMDIGEAVWCIDEIKCLMCHIQYA